MPCLRALEKSEYTSVSQCVAPRSSEFKLVESTATEIMQTMELLSHMNSLGQAFSGRVI